VFDSLTVTGLVGAVMYGSREAVVIKSWRITRSKADGGHWMLSARIDRVVSLFYARQAPLLFTAPRAHGFWMWPIDAIEIGETNLRAYLGPPER